MDKLELALELIRRAQQERKRLNGYNNAINSLQRANNPEYWHQRDKIELKYSPTPRKAIINDSLKMARRILSEEYV